MKARSLLLLFVLLLLQAAPAKGLLGKAAPSCAGQTPPNAGAVAALATKALPTVRTAPALEPARMAGGCCSGNAARDGSQEALEDNSGDGPRNGCSHCTCNADEAPPYTAEFPAPPTAASKSLAPVIIWILAGLETFVRDLPSMGDSYASFLQSLCVTPVQPVERNVYHCVFQT